MDAKSPIIKPFPKQGLSEHVRAAPTPAEPRPSREEAEAAVRTLIAFAGDDPKREGLLDTPKRVIGMPVHRSDVVFAPPASRSIRARRVGSARACQISGFGAPSGWTANM